MGEEPKMDSLSELVWTLVVIGTIDAVFMFWLAGRAARRGRPNRVIASAELLAARARRQRI
jgi:hypothetical protein